jgi:capsular exopolysaccharide synthesis family protein
MNAADVGLPAPEPTERGVDLPDFGRLASMLRRQWLLLVVVTLTVFAGMVIFTFRQAPRYTATVTIMMNTRSNVLSGLQQPSSDAPDDSGEIDTEVEVLKSRALTDQVVKALNLDNDPEFNARLRSTSPAGRLIKKPLDLLDALFTPGGGRALGGADGDRIKSHNAVIDSVLKSLNVRRLGATSVTDISFRSLDPVKAAAIANGYADQYLIQQMDAKYESSQTANHWLTQRLAELQPQVEQAEAAVQQYKAQHGLLASVGSTLTEQEISNLDTQLDQAKADLAEKDARMRTAQQDLQAGSTGENLAGPLASPTISALRAQQAEASSKLAEIQTTYGPRHPDTQRAQHQLAEINTQISAELSRQVDNLRSEDSIASQRVASLQASLANAKGTLVGNNAASVELADLQRRASAASALYDSLLSRATQVSTGQGGEQPDARIVSHASVPNRPSSPNKPLNLALGLMLGLAAGVGCVWLIEALSRGLNTPEEVERVFNLPHLAPVLSLKSTVDHREPGREVRRRVADRSLSILSAAFRKLRAAILASKGDDPILDAGRNLVDRPLTILSEACSNLRAQIPPPKARDDEPVPDAGRYVAEKPLSIFSEAFRNLRASILFSKGEGPVKVVALTSAIPGEGKTTTTLCLGKSMAMSGAKVVVVDCDLRCGDINRQIGGSPEFGLLEVLHGTAKLDDVLVRDEASGAWFLPLADAIYTPRDLFGTPAMDDLLEALRQRFDFVLLDTAPVLPVSDTRILAAKADIVLLLVKWRSTPRKLIEFAINSLNFAGADIAGIVLTQVDARELAKYENGYAGFYNAAYRKYYVQ